jgi:hypothetical protein
VHTSHQPAPGHNKYNRYVQSYSYHTPQPDNQAPLPHTIPNHSSPQNEPYHTPRIPLNTN